MEEQKVNGNNSAEQAAQTAQPQTIQMPTKFCKNCGGKIAEKAIICPLCGCQVEELPTRAAETQQPQQIIINNANTNVNQNNMARGGGKPKNKWVAFLLCLLLGVFGAHKFYEGRILGGIIYLFTGGLFLIGVICDLIAILLKPDPYYV